MLCRIGIHALGGIRYCNICRDCGYQRGITVTTVISDGTGIIDGAHRSAVERDEPATPIEDGGAAIF